MMEFDTGVIIIGDINPGAKVVAKGSIVVLGALKGEAEAVQEVMTMLSSLPLIWHLYSLE